MTPRSWLFLPPLLTAATTAPVPQTLKGSDNTLDLPLSVSPPTLAERREGQRSCLPPAGYARISPGSPSPEPLPCMLGSSLHISRLLSFATVGLEVNNSQPSLELIFVNEE